MGLMGAGRSGVVLGAVAGGGGVVRVHKKLVDGDLSFPGRGKTTHPGYLQLPVYQLQWKPLLWCHLWLQQQPSLVRPAPVPRQCGE